MPSPWWFPNMPGGSIRPVPWLHPAVIAYLDTLIRPAWNILEHGSGGSTLWFAKRARAVIAIENDPGWYKHISKVLPRNAAVILETHECIPDPLQFRRGRAADLLLIDGKPLSVRNLWLAAVERLVRPGGIVVLDNAEREALQDQRESLRWRAAHYMTITGNHHKPLMVTEFYRMPGGGDNEKLI